MNFQETITAGYAFSGESLPLGRAMHSGEVLTDITVSLPLATMSRHGLIAGATGTGKTKTIQKLLEWLSDAGVPSVMMDMKGDVSGMALAGSPSEKLAAYIANLGSPEWNPRGFPVEFFSLVDEGGSQIRATISELGPQLLARVLGLSDVQEATLSVIFAYADANGLLLVDLEDLKSLLSFISQYGKEELREYGQISSATLQVIMRQIIAFEGQSAGRFFGEKSLDISDLMVTHEGWKGQINIFRLMNALRFPQLFSTVMLQIVGELFHSLPEVGDVSKPRLVIVIDEAHLLFRDLSPRLLSELEMMMKLIRSKGVGILFCTQNPLDIPESILSQLGLKIQHALRVFTAKDQESIRKMAKNFPLTSYYDVATELTTLGTGEALITALGEDGRPTPLVTAKILPPESRMDTITAAELGAFLSISPIFPIYQHALNPESATEILVQKMQLRAEEQAKQEQIKAQQQAEKVRKKSPSLTDSIVQSATQSIGTELARNIATKIGGRQLGTTAASIARSVFGSIFR